MGTEWGRQLAIVRRWSLVLVSVAIVSGLGGYLYASSQASEYEASVIMSVGGTTHSAEYNDRLVARDLAFEFAALAETPAVLDKAAARIQVGDGPPGPYGRVRAAVSETGARITIVATAEEPGPSTALANAIAAELVDTSRGDQGPGADLAAQALTMLRAEILRQQGAIQAGLADPETTAADVAALQGQLNELWSTYSELLAVSRDEATGSLVIVQPAVAPVSSSQPPIYFALLAAVGGLLLATVIVFLVEYFDPVIRHPDEVASITGLPSLGTVVERKGDVARGHPNRLVALQFPFSSAAEAYRTIRARIDLELGERKSLSVQLTGLGDAGGRASVAANLAIVYAQTGRRVLLIDGDLRQPSLHAILGTPNQTGLSSLLQGAGGPIDAATAITILHTPQPNLNLLPSGPVPANPAELIGSDRMRATVVGLLSAYDLIVINSPSVGLLSDPLVLSSMVQRTIFVMGPQKSKRSELIRAVRSLMGFNAALVGTITYERRSGSTRDAATNAAKPDRRSPDERARYETERLRSG